MVAVILAGGKGTRLKSICDDRPKPMFPVAGKPVLLHQVEALKRVGIRDFVFVLGYRAEQIIAFFEDGKKWDVHISYVVEDEPRGTAGSLFDLNLTGDFLLCNGDLIFDFSLQRMLEFHKYKNALGTLFAHPNNHPNSSTLLSVDDNSCICGFSPVGNHPRYYENICSAGIYLLSPKLLSLCSKRGFVRLDQDVLAPAANTKRLFAYMSTEYVHDMGTPEQLASVEIALKRGIVNRRNLECEQRAVFLDRDGTINKYKGFIVSPDEIELLPGVTAAIKRINESGYLAIMVTNQPVVARGACSMQQLRLIHNKIETLLGNEGAYLDAIYVCPHHPDRGFPGENPVYKIKCECRKPAPGLLLQAAEAFHIDLSASYMVGDTQRDVQTAKNAGCKPVLLRCGENSNISDSDAETKIYHDLYAFSLDLDVI